VPHRINPKPEHRSSNLGRTPDKGTRSYNYRSTPGHPQGMKLEDNVNFTYLHEKRQFMYPSWSIPPNATGPVYTLILTTKHCYKPWALTPNKFGVVTTDQGIEYPGEDCPEEKIAGYLGRSFRHIDIPLSHMQVFIFPYPASGYNWMVVPYAWHEDLTPKLKQQHYPTTAEEIAKILEE